MLKGKYDENEFGEGRREGWREGNKSQCETVNLTLQLEVNLTLVLQGHRSLMKRAMHITLQKGGLTPFSYCLLMQALLD